MGRVAPAFAREQRQAAGGEAPRPFYRKLYVQVLAAVLLGALLGYLRPDLGIAVQPLSTAFIRAIRAIIGPIIFTTVVVGIATIGDLRHVARIGIKSLIYFEVVSTLALLIGLAVGNLLPLGAGVNADAASLNTEAVAAYVAGAKSLTLVGFLLDIIPTSFVGAFTGNDTCRCCSSRCCSASRSASSASAPSRWCIFLSSPRKGFSPWCASSCMPLPWPRSARSPSR